MTRTQRFLKRSFDIFASALALVAFGWLIALATIIATFDTGRFGLFVQRRVGQYGKSFSVLKIRTMRDSGLENYVTVENDARITRIGRVFRNTKIDELPQILNVLAGHMSLVGPRPDVEGYWDDLKGDARRVLNLRPGLTGPATIVFMDEESLLESQDDPNTYNDSVLFPKKVRLNLDYYDNYSFIKDMQCIVITAQAVCRRCLSIARSILRSRESLANRKEQVIVNTPVGATDDHK